MWPFKKKARQPVLSEEVRELLRSLSIKLRLQTQGNQAQIITFIAARNGEGTSTLAYNYAEFLAQDTGKKVLLIDGSADLPRFYANRGMKNKLGLVDAAIEGEPSKNALTEVHPGLTVTRWISNKHNRQAADRITQSADFWKRLMSEYATVIIDSPSLQSSFDGLMLAAKASHTIIVTEAEKTPAPVVLRLKEMLANAGANITGVALTKRRFYIPARVYNKI